MLVKCWICNFLDSGDLGVLCPSGPPSKRKSGKSKKKTDKEEIDIVDDEEDEDIVDRWFDIVEYENTGLQSYHLRDEHREFVNLSHFVPTPVVDDECDEDNTVYIDKNGERWHLGATKNKVEVKTNKKKVKKLKKLYFKKLRERTKKMKRKNWFV